MRLHYCLIVVAGLVSACSSVNTVRNPSSKNLDGLVYYMPEKDFLVTIVVASGAVTSAVIGTTSSYPDMSKRYVLKHKMNAFGKNTLDVVIGPNNLLTSAKSKTVSSVNEVFRSIGQIMGTIDPMFVGPAVPATCGNGTHTFIYTANDVSRKDLAPCGLKLTIDQMSTPAVIEGDQSTEKSGSGVYYRQNIPYKIVVQGGAINSAAIVLSPSNSPDYFLPVSKTFFANNDSELGFADGVPTGYKQDTDGEVVALLKMPAEVISAYFTAVGQIFTNFKNTDSGEGAALEQEVKLELQKRKYEACKIAIKNDDKVTISSLGC